MLHKNCPPKAEVVSSNLAGCANDHGIIDMATTFYEVFNLGFDLARIEANRTLSP